MRRCVDFPIYCSVFRSQLYIVRCCPRFRCRIYVSTQSRMRRSPGRETHSRYICDTSEHPLAKIMQWRKGQVFGGKRIFFCIKFSLRPTLRKHQTLSSVMDTIFIFSSKFSNHGSGGCCGEESSLIKNESCAENNEKEIEPVGAYLQDQRWSFGHDYNV